MTPIFEETSTITSKGQTTIPKTVRQALDVAEGDKIAFRIDENGVTIRRATDEAADPAMAAFLSFLARDLAAHPEQISAFPQALAERIMSLTGQAAVDPDAPIDGEVDL